MSDNELIRRGDALDAAWEADSLELSTHGAGKIEARINAIPAAQPTVKPLGADGVTVHPQDILNAAWRDDLGEEGLAMYSRILSALDVQPTVSPDVVAPDEVYDTMMEVQRNPTGAWQAIQDQADTITTLRAQLAEAHKDGSQLAAWQCLFDDGKTGIVCDDWGNQYCAMQRRADRAEAALAAQIEADAWQPIETAPKDGTFFLAWFSSRKKHCVAWRRKHVIDGDLWASFLDVYPDRWSSQPTHWMPLPNPPPNQPHDRTALDRYREKVLREAAEILDDEGWLGMSKHRILALIEKEKTE